MTSRASRRLLIATALSALTLAACVPKRAPAPAPAPPTTTTTAPTTTTTTPAAATGGCTSAQAQSGATPSAPLTASQAEAEATEEFQTAPAPEADGDVQLTTVERVGADLEISTVVVGSADQAADVAAAAAQGSDLLSVEASQPVVALEDDGTTRAAVANDALRSQQWALDAIAFESTWTTTNGAGAIVAVVDTGVQSTHPDLSGQLLPGYRFWHDSTGAREGAMSPAFDDHGHGTHVAGIVAALSNNAAGVAGASPGVKILPVKVLDSQGSGWSDDVARGISWAVANGADVVSLSLGGGYSTAIHNAVDSAVANGVLVFAAAGNGGAGGAANYPGAEANAIAVGSVTSSLVRSSFSTTGSYLDIAAPGSSIQSTYPTSAYRSLSGTSMATPYAAAEGALLVAARPTWSVAQLRDRLLTTANDLGAAGPDSEYGCGLVDPVEALS
jgi:subtilisin family serine protease